MAEDPVKDGLNWYAYCAGNPVNFVDPWGLKTYPKMVEKWCKNYAEMDQNSQSFKNISSAANAYAYGFISKEALLRNIVENGGVINKDMKLSGVTITRTKDSVTVDAKIYFHGNMVNDIHPSSVEDNPATFRELAISGIEEQWSGEVNGVTITTNVQEVTAEEAAIYDIIDVDINTLPDDNDTHSMTLTNTRKVFMYNGDNRGSKIVYSVQSFKNTMAHEFAHAGLNLADAYDGKFAYYEFDSVMHNNVDCGVSPLDLEMFLLSLDYKGEGYFSYANAMELVEENSY